MFNSYFHKSRICKSSRVNIFCNHIESHQAINWYIKFTLIWSTNIINYRIVFESHDILLLQMFVTNGKMWWCILIIHIGNMNINKLVDENVISYGSNLVFLLIVGNVLNIICSHWGCIFNLKVWNISYD